MSAVSLPQAHRNHVRWLLLTVFGGAVALASLYAAGRIEQRREAEYLQLLASSEARHIDLQLETYKAALLTIANSDALVGANDLEILRREAVTVGEYFGGWFVLATAGDTLEILMQTSNDAPPPPPEPRSAYPEVRAAEQEALRTGQPVVTDAFPGRAVGQPVVTLVMPVPAREASGTGRFLYMSFDMQHLSRLLAGHDLPEDQFSAIADGSRRIIAHSVDIESYRLAPLPDWYVEASEGIDSGILVGAPVGAPNDARIFAMQRLSAAPSWTLVVSASSRPVLLAGLGTSWPVLVTIAAVLLILAVASARDRYRRIEAARLAAEAEAAEKSALLEALKAAEQRKSTLMGIVGHELRTPLIAQLGVLDLLEAGLSDAEVAPLIEQARREGHGMLGLLDDLLEVARLGTGEVRLRPVEIDPRRLFDEVAAILRPLAARKGNSVVVELTGDLTPFCADLAALRRILLNFGSNAAKFTTSGTITLGFDARPLGDGQSQICLSVRDTGPGIAPEDLKNLFEEFAVLDATRHLASEGTGLGLAISKGLAEAMGGSVRVESTLGEGATFTAELTLPKASSRPDPEMEAPPFDFDGVRILAVEDQHILRRLLARQLRSAGAVVETAADGEQAVARAAELPFDLILMDLRLPGLDGAAAAAQIKGGEGPNATTPIIALSAHKPENVEDLLRGGTIRACLTKPIDLRALACELGLVTDDQSEAFDDPAAPSLIDAEAVDWLAEDRSFAADLFNSFEAEALQVLGRIRTAFEADDLTLVSYEAHGLSGLAKVCGAAGLGRALDRLDRAALRRDREAVVAAIETAGRVAEETLAVFSAKVSENMSANC